MTSPTLQGELRIAVRDREGRCVRRARCDNQVLAAGRAYAVECLAGRLSDQNYAISIGTSSEPTRDDQIRLHQGLLTQRHSREGPRMIDGRAVFTEVFEPSVEQFEPSLEWKVAEAGLEFWFSRPGQSGMAVLYNRALLDRPIPLAPGDSMTVTFAVYFDWIGETPS